MQHAYRLERTGIDGVTFQFIESGEGEAEFISKLQQELKEKTYRAQPCGGCSYPRATEGEGRWGIQQK